jgi:sugar transferase (PEP-CTERM system associated)
LVIAEVVIIFGSVYAGQAISSFNSLFEPVYPKALVIVFVTITTFYVANLYDLRFLRRKRELLARIIPCYCVIAFVVAGLGFTIPYLRLSREEYILSFAFSFPAIIVFRIIYYLAINVRRLREKVLILGATNIARRILKELKSGHNPGFEVLGCVAEGGSDHSKEALGCRILGSIRDLQWITRETRPDVVVVALSERRGTFPAQEILGCKLQGVRVEDWPTFYEKLTGKILIQNLRPSWLIFADGFTRNRLMRAVKRVVDTLLAVVGLCVSLPLMVCIAILTKLDSVGPVFFKQERVGENGKIFTLYKFRTMVADAEERSGPVWSQTSDPRVTRLGRILRRTGMDEIPQLLNVLKGDMSFVGPRPERPHFVAELQKRIPYYPQRLVVKPGITGWAQVRYGYGATLEDAIEKLQYDLYYIKNMSIFLDLLIILSTVHKVLFAKVAVEAVAEGGSSTPTPQTAGDPSDHTAVTKRGVAVVEAMTAGHAKVDFATRGKEITEL